MDSMNYKDTYRRHYDYMMLALAPLIISASVVYSSRVLLVCAVAFVTARIVDVAMAVLRKQDIDVDDKSSTVAALTFCMMLPVSVPLYIVAVTVALTVMVGKHAFGGKDAYPFSLAALAMCVAAVNWPNEVFKAVTPLSAVNFWTGAAESALTGSSQIKLGGLPYISTFDLLLGNHPAAIGSAFVLIIVAIGVFLLATKQITWHIPVSFLATCAAFSLAFPRIYGVSRIYSLKYEILCSAIVFYAVFMMNEPATTPKNPRAKLIFGVLTGVLTMLFRYFGSYEIGGCFALLLVNATEGYWDRLFEEGSLRSAGKAISCSLKIGTKASENSEKEKAVKPKTEKKAKPVKEESVAETHTRHSDAEGKKVYKKENTSANKSSKNTKSKTEKAPRAKKSSKPADAVKQKKERKPKDADQTKMLDIISRAEDEIDQVSFSTQTIDMEQALREFEERYKGGK